jgi:6-phosphogluconolactonase/glucosamine-6-phosphate isomerase/deaminase
VLQRAKKSVFFLKGESKKKVWEEMLASTEDEKRWPAKAVLAATEVKVIGQW